MLNAKNLYSLSELIELSSSLNVNGLTLAFLQPVGRAEKELEQLNMQKIGEVVAVLPKTDTNKIIETDIRGTETQNWKKWWALLK